MLDEGSGDLNAHRAARGARPDRRAPRHRDRLRRDAPDADERSRASPIARASAPGRHAHPARVSSSATSIASASCGSTGWSSCATCRRRSPTAPSPSCSIANHPVRTPADRDAKASLRALTLRRRLARSIARVFVPSRTTVVAAGDASHERAGGCSCERAFGGWTPAGDAPACRRSGATRRAAVAAGPRGARPSRRRRAVGAAHRPHGRGARARPTITRCSSLNMVLGGQFVSRINMNLREDKGYTYGARTAFDFRRGPGPFVAPDERPVGRDRRRDPRGARRRSRAIRGDRPVTREELETGRAALTRGYPAQLRDRRADRPRRRAARALRPARRLLLDVRADACSRSTRRMSRASPPSTSIRRGS